MLNFATSPEGGSEVSTALYFKKTQNVTNYEND